ncbi:MAG: peptidoglycan DD-metalloendopeptidase family protein [Elusimicrobia bacterium]|nr:peptidoglycan DD-metalloendopeptidase family protein [Elusimicrobiota bacterium]
MISPHQRTRYWLAAGLAFFLTMSLVLFIRKMDRFAGPVKPPEPDVIVTTGTVKEGDVFALMLSHSGVPALHIPQIERAMSQLYDLRHIQPGHAYEIVSSTTGVFQKFVYHINPVHSYSVVRSSQNVFSAEEKTIDTVWMEKRVSGKITENMYKDLRKMGYDETFVANLVGDLADNIFGWRIDFFTEQRPGDTFDVLMEQEFPVGGDKPLWNGRGRILAARYIGHATKVKENIAVRYDEPGSKHAEYFDDDGKAVRRAFLRAPFTHGAFRVSSGFNPHRFHPILRIYRPHHGTDYAAAYGTPVAAIGKGVVVRAGWVSGYGNCIDIRHTPRYTSRYGHLSKIAVHKGDSIAQGEYIGRVGNTGLSTGPHLHFEMIIDGESRNFLAMTFPSASAVADAHMADFKKVRDELLARLDAAKVNQVSMSTAAAKTAAR